MNSLESIVNWNQCFDVPKILLRDPLRAPGKFLKSSKLRLERSGAFRNPELLEQVKALTGTFGPFWNVAFPPPIDWIHGSTRIRNRKFSPSFLTQKLRNCQKIVNSMWTFSVGSPVRCHPGARIWSRNGIQITHANVYKMLPKIRKF